MKDAQAYSNAIFTIELRDRRNPKPKTISLFKMSSM